MKYYIIGLICFTHIFANGQNPRTCQISWQNEHETRYSSYEYEYDSLDRLTLEKSYSDFDFKNLSATQMVGYLGDLKNFLHYQSYDTLGNVIRSRKYQSTINEDCKLDVKTTGYFGICSDYDLDTTITIDYVAGCQNGWVDLINAFCVDYARITNWTRRSIKSENFIKTIDTILVNYTPNYTSVLFSERSYLNGNLVRNFHNITDVIGNNLTTYAYDDYNNLISYDSEQVYDNELLLKQSRQYNHTYKDDLLIETISQYSTLTISNSSTISYFYDDQKRLIKSEEVSNSTPLQITTKIYTYLNILNNSQNVINDFTLFPNPTHGIIQINLPSDQLDDIKIYTNQGIEVKPNNIDVHFIDISNLSNGIYYLTANKDGEKLISKFIKI